MELFLEFLYIPTAVALTAVLWRFFEKRGGI